MISKHPVAVIDVGSNSIKILIARVAEATGGLETIFTKTLETRISAGISRAKPRLTEDAINRGCTAIQELVNDAKAHAACEIQIVATSAVRDAENGSEFTARVKQATGIEIRILNGEDEAAYIGKGLACDPEIAGTSAFVQMDIGGGSLELIRFEDSAIQRAISLQLGAVRLTELFIEDCDAIIPPAVQSRINDHVIQTIEESGFQFEPPGSPLIVTGGAFVVSRNMLAALNSTTIETRPPILSKLEITGLKDMLCLLPLEERRRIKGLPPTRADIVPTALIAIEAVMNLSKRDSVTHSFYNLRYGIAAELLRL